MAKKSRDKGKAGELEIVHVLDRRGLPYLREQDGRVQGSDFVIDRAIAAEVKRRETFQMVKHHADVEGAADGLIPAVFWRPSRQPWRASLLLDDLLDLYERGR